MVASFRQITTFEKMCKHEIIVDVNKQFFKKTNYCNFVHTYTLYSEVNMTNHYLPMTV